MHGIGTNGEGRSRKQLANPGSPWKWPLKWCVRWRNWQLYFCIALWTWVCGSMWLYLCYSVLYTSSGLLTCIWWYVLLIGKENGAYSGLRKSKRTGSNKSVASEYVLLYNVIIIIVVKKIIFSNVVQLKGLTMLNSSEYRWQCYWEVKSRCWRNDYIAASLEDKQWFWNDDVWQQTVPCTHSGDTNGTIINGRMTCQWNDDCWRGDRTQSLLRLSAKRPTDVCYGSVTWIQRSTIDTVMEMWIFIGENFISSLLIVSLLKWLAAWMTWLGSTAKWKRVPPCELMRSWQTNWQRVEMLLGRHWRWWNINV